jgi:hypothetical protein
MTAIGKLLVASALAAALAAMTWATTLYAERPGWFAESADSDVDKGHKPANFKQMKAEIDALGRAAAVASESWGTHLKALEAREKLRVERQAGYAQYVLWAHKGNPRDPIDKDNPRLGGKGFYQPVVDPATRLYDLSAPGGIPKGAPVVGTDGAPLPGLDGLLNSITGDTEAINELNKQIVEARKKFDEISKDVRQTEDRAIAMGAVRDSVQAELFFLQGFEVNVSETRDTVFRRERQLRNRLKSLGVGEP